MLGSNVTVSLSKIKTIFNKGIAYKVNSMKVAIMIQAVRALNCPLPALSHPDFKFVLMGGDSVVESLTPDNLNFFSKVHTFSVNELTPDVLAPVVEKYINQYGKNNVRLVTSDEGMIPVVAKLRFMFDLVGHKPEHSDWFSNKLVMRDVAEKGQIRVPKQMAFDMERYKRDPKQYLDSILDAFQLPFIVKPVTLAGAAGFKKILKADMLRSWAEKASKKPFQYLVAEFIEGKLFHLNSVIRDQSIAYAEFEEYTHPCALFSEGKLLGSIQVLRNDPRWKRLNQFNDDVMQAFTPPDGATHLEVFWTPQDELVFLEIAARTPGAFFPKVHEKLTDIHFEIEHFKARLGIPTNLIPATGRPYSAWAMIPRKIGTITHLNKPNVKSKCVIDWYVAVGDNIKLPPLADTDLIFATPNVAGVVMLYHHDYAQLYQDFLVLREADLIEVADRNS